MTAFERFHGDTFPPLHDRPAWIAKLREMRPHITEADAMKEWHNRRCDQAAQAADLRADDIAQAYSYYV
jgi:hypothetical protein